QRVLLHVLALVETYEFVSVVLLFLLAAPPLIYTLSLHDALPISFFKSPIRIFQRIGNNCPCTLYCPHDDRKCSQTNRARKTYHRSEEHTSELQSQSNLVCRLLLEKKKQVAELRAEDALDRRLRLA